ncbi:S49 family peptidase [Acetobacter oryzifermentans]|uniref:Serine peptidase n=1 Tax=Acetobacter oryzifermentans TaxID=1633874 RepID=A0ABM6AK82_9PROT|nr:S49 family peptidase [Acetobacter oryzifermentans]ANA14175.1 serine peptidase [Acetobacter oryzifermentans]
MKQYAHTQALIGAPIALSSRKLDIVRGLLASGADDKMLFGPVDDNARYAAQSITENVSGIAVIAINGILLPGSSNGCWWLNATFYDDISNAINLATQDETVRGIVLHVNSPGGAVAGCFDTGDRIYAARESKPVIAIVDEQACSAAYALACSAEKIVLPRTGEVGSIGVVYLHADITKFLDETGIKVTTFQTGARKTDTYPTTPMSEDARKIIQNDIESMGKLFFETVARNRGLSAQDVQDMEAGLFYGQAAVSAGLADAVMSRDSAFLDFLAHLK